MNAENLPTDEAKQALDIAMNQANNKEYAAAIDILNKLLYDYPLRANYHSNIAILYTKINSMDRACCHYKKAICIQPWNHILHTQYANFLYITYNDKEAASYHFEKAIQNTPTDAKTHVMYAKFLRYAQHNDTKSEYHFKRSIDLNPNDDRTLYEYAKLLHHMNKLKLSMQYFQKCMELHSKRDPEPNIWHQYNYALLLKDLKDYDAACSHFETCLSLCSSYVHHRINHQYGLLLCELHYVSKGLSYLHEAYRQMPDNMEYKQIFNHYKNISVNQPNNDAAKDYLDKVNENDEPCTPSSSSNTESEYNYSLPPGCNKALLEPISNMDDDDNKIRMIQDVQSREQDMMHETKENDSKENERKLHSMEHDRVIISLNNIIISQRKKIHFLEEQKTLLSAKNESLEQSVESMHDYYKKKMDELNGTVEGWKSKYLEIQQKLEAMQKTVSPSSAQHSVHYNTKTLNAPQISVDSKDYELKHEKNDIDEGMYLGKLEQLSHAMELMTTKTFDIDSVDILGVLNDFNTLLTDCEWNDDRTFEIIHDGLRRCNVYECNMFRRNYRNRNKYNNKDAHNTAQYQILDKIHCFLLHSFDMGHKLTSKERELINHIGGDWNEEDFDKSLINRRTMKLNEILCKKHKMRDGIDGLQKRVIEKYNQLESNIINDKTYSFGVKFAYDGEYIGDTPSGVTDVGKKYHSLKHELICNQVEKISMQQFNVEYKKAEIHFNTYFRKKNYSDISIQCLLSLMIYCNYDSLQRQFSLTYRDKIHLHVNFYHLGKFIKHAIHQFGVPVDNESIKSFYHGIGEQLALPSIISDVCIYCPLSTSSSFEVATNFTNLNNGLIIEFGASRAGKDVKYFPVSWISDYANESEHLFIQNNYPLEINNITNAMSGYDYEIILKALKIIDRIMNGGNIFNNIDSLTVKKIIHHRLSLKELNGYKPLKSLNKYANILISTYFDNKKQLKITHLKNGIYSFLHNILLQGNYQWIDMKLIIALFPNIELIELENITLNPSILKHILSSLQHLYNKVKRISITTNAFNGMSAKTAIEQYKTKFMAIKFTMKTGSYKTNRLLLTKKL